MLVLSGLFYVDVMAQDATMPNGRPEPFPEPAISQANFSSTHQISMRVPTKLKIRRTSDALFVAIDTNGFESTNLMVGTNVEMVVQNKLFVWPAGEIHPTNWVRMGQSGLNFDLGTALLSTNLDGLPKPGTSYIVEMDLTAFETEERGGRSRIFPWSTNYKIIWQRTLKQIVQ